MKLGFFIYSMQGGGAERIVSKLANYAVDKKEEVVLFLLDSSRIAFPLKEQIKIVTISQRTTGNRLGRTMSRLREIRQAVKQEKIEVLFAFTNTMFVYGALCCKGLKTKIVGAERANPKNHARATQWLIKCFAPWCDGFVFQTEGARQCYPKSIAKRGIVIPNPAPIIPVVSKEKKQHSPIQICTTGRLHLDKDYDTLLKAYKIYLEKFPNSQLAIFGDGELKNYYQQECIRMEIADKVIFQGFTKSICEQLSEYDLFVFASKSEGMPNALLEAMAAGLPCISTDCDFGPRELIQNGVNGLLCKVAEPHDMAEKMVWMVEHEKERVAMGREALKVQQHYAEEEIFKKYLEYAASMSDKRRVL